MATTRTIPLRRLVPRLRPLRLLQQRRTPRRLHRTEGGFVIQLADKNTCINCGWQFTFRPQTTPHCNSPLHCSTECVHLGNRYDHSKVITNLEALMRENGITPAQLARTVGDVKNPRTGAVVTANAPWIRRRLRNQVIPDVGEIGLMCVAAGTTLQEMMNEGLAEIPGDLGKQSEIATRDQKGS